MGTRKAEKVYSPEIGDVVTFAPQPRDFDLIEGMDRPNPQFPVFRCYRVVSGADRAPMVEALEGGPILGYCRTFFIGVQHLPRLTPRTNRWRLKKVDAVSIPGIRDEVGLWLGTPQLRERFSTHISLNAHGLRLGRIYETDQWIIHGKVLTLKGVTGAYYVALFDEVGPA